MGDEGKCSPQFLDALRKKTHFTRQEMEALCRVYRSLASAGDGGVDRVVFRELLHNTFDLVTEDVLLERVFSAFDRCNDGVVRLEEWLQGLSVFLRGTPRERTAFCFLVYDLNADGFVTRDEMFQLLRNCLVKHPGDEDPDEGVKDLVELALRKLDGDKDGKVSFDDFQAAVDKEPLLLEAFGQCLPAEGACHTFLQTLHTDN